MGLIFDGVDIEATYGIVVDGADTWVKPARDRELVHVPGRSGDLIYDNGSWTNVTLTYHCHVTWRFADRFEAFCDWLFAHFGYFRFEDQQRHPGVYRMCEFAGPIDPETVFRDQMGNFDFVLNAKPQQWLESGEEAVTLTYATWVKGYWHYWSADGASGYEFIEITGNKGIATPIVDLSLTDLEHPWLALRVVCPTSMAQDFADETIIACLDENMNLISAGVCGGHDFVVDSDTANSKTYMYRYYQNSNHEWPAGTKYIQMSVNGEYGIVAAEISYTLVEYDEAVAQYIPEELEDEYPSSTVDPREWSVYTEQEKFILNNTNYTARPVIEIDAPAGVNFVINNYTITIGEIDVETLIIDCELEDCYSYDSNDEVVNQNGAVTITCSDDRELSDFPYIVPGGNYFEALLNSQVTRAGSDIVSSIRMKPNWYRI